MCFSPYLGVGGGGGTKKVVSLPSSKAEGNRIQEFDVAQAQFSIFDL